ncbi:MAG: hypothetical protein SFW67_03880 [Myxococcaceae bacterium]|nr:hypothetical protein [Myxococcaceae bacterium]
MRFLLVGVVSLLALVGCGPVVCVRSCETVVSLTVSGTSDLQSVQLTDPSCPAIGSVDLAGRVATFETACRSFGVDVRTVNGGRFTGTVTPTVTRTPGPSCLECGTALVEVAVALP